MTMNAEPKTLPSEMIQKLRAPLPPEAIKPHPTKPYLSTIKVIYAVERLNDVFGLGGWRVRNEVVESAATMVVVKATLTVPAYGIEVENFGGNDNSDRGDAYKGACTDALSKICSYLYIGMDVYKGHADAKQPLKANGHAQATTAMPRTNAAPTAQAKPAQATTKRIISEGQAKRFYAMSKQGGHTAAEITAKLNAMGFKNSKEITTDVYESLCEWVQQQSPTPARFDRQNNPEITDEDIPF